MRIVVGVGGAGSNLLETCGAGSRATYPQVAPKGIGGQTSGVGRAGRREWVKTAVILPCPTPTTIGVKPLAVTFLTPLPALPHYHICTTF
ncbi:MAG: hypothetical protein OT477_23140 [Chloroflexi bacterium]|nr:hypothetical protein [Chloroflexota bacterium]